MLIGVSFKRCFSVHEVILREVTLCVCVDVAWLILTLQVNALSHYSLSLVQTVGSLFLFFFSKLLCTDVMFLHWKKPTVATRCFILNVCAQRESLSVCC